MLEDLFETTSEKQLEEALAPMSLGDRKPSHLARDIERLMSGMTIGDVKKNAGKSLLELKKEILPNVSNGKSLLEL